MKSRFQGEYEKVGNKPVSEKAKELLRKAGRTAKEKK